MFFHQRKMGKKNGKNVIYGATSKESAKIGFHAMSKLESLTDIKGQGIYSGPSLGGGARPSDPPLLFENLLSKRGQI